MRTFQRAYLLCPALCIALLASATDPIRGAHGFIENKGQLHDQCGAAVPQVRYLWPTNKGANVQVLRDGISYDTFSPATCEQGDAGDVVFRRLDLRFINALPTAITTAYQPREGRMHFIGRDGVQVRDVHEYDRVRVEGILAGVDIDLRIIDGGRMKYDIVLHEGADLAQVRMQYSGYDAVRVRGDEIEFMLGAKRFTERIPASWSLVDGKPVQVRYRVVQRAHDHIVLGLQRADAVEPMTCAGMVVDPLPNFEWGTYLGGDLDDAATCNALDNIGMLYTGGRTAGLLTTVTTGGYQNTYGGGDTDGFLTKVAAHGSRLWCTYFGGAGADEVLGVHVDRGFTTRIVGRTRSNEGIASDSTALLASPDHDDGFVAVFDSSGQRVWSAYVGGALDDEVLAVVADTLGHTYICGITASTDLFNTALLPPTQAYHGQGDAFVARVDTAGIHQCTFLGGEEGDTLRAMVLRYDQSALHLVGGTRSATEISTTDTLHGGMDGWSIALDTMCVVLWSHYIGGIMDDALTDIAFYADTLAICGWSSSTGIADSNAYLPGAMGGMDAIVLSADVFGTVLGTTYFRGTGDDRANGIAFDHDGRIYITGSTTSDSIGVTEQAPQSLPGGAHDAFLARLVGTDSLDYATWYGGEGEDVGSSIAVNGNTVVNVVGTTTSTTGVAASGFQMTPGGGIDALLSRFKNNESTPCEGISTGGVDGPCTGGGSPWPPNSCNGCPYTPQPPAHLVCRGDSVTFCTSGGALAYGHYWMWYGDVCGDPQHFLGIGPCVTFAPQQSMMLYVRSECVECVAACTSLYLTVEDYPVPVATAPAYVCAGEEISLSGSGGVHHNWQGPGGLDVDSAMVQVPSDSLAGVAVFTYTASSQWGCARSDTTSVVIHQTASVPWTIEDVTCNGGSDGSIATDSTNAAHHTFNWPALNATAPMVDQLAAGSYLVITTDTLGCSRTDVLLVAEPAHPVDTVMVQRPSCALPNGSIQVVMFNGDAGHTFQWIPDLGAASAIDSLASGTFTAQITDSLGCLFIVSAMLTDTGSVEAWTAADTLTILAGDSVELAVFFAPASLGTVLVWQPASDLLCDTCATTLAEPPFNTLYTVVVTTAFGCTATDSTYVILLQPPQPKLFLPTHFSPNGDGLNDRYEALGGNFTRMRLEIVDAQGKLVFAEEGNRPAWDGTANGRPATTGVYTYSFTGEHADGALEQFTGQVTLMR